MTSALPLVCHAALPYCQAIHGANCVQGKVDQVLHRNSDKEAAEAERKRIDIEAGLDNSDVSDTASDDAFALLAAKEEGHDIKFRTLTWQKATLLLFAEYVCLAILALPWSFSVLGWGVGLVVQIGMGLIAWCESRLGRYPCGTAS